jgi:hypothetical protein
MTTLPGDFSLDMDGGIFSFGVVQLIKAKKTRAVLINWNRPCGYKKKAVILIQNLTSTIRASTHDSPRNIKNTGISSCPAIVFLPE